MPEVSLQEKANKEATAWRESVKGAGHAHSAAETTLSGLFQLPVRAANELVLVQAGWDC